MTIKRKYNRRYLSYFFRVFNSDTGNSIGQVADISPAGFMVRSEELIQTGTDYHLALDLTTVMNFEQVIVFDARCVWSIKDFDHDSYKCGFEIKKINEEDIDAIKQLIEVFGD